jgi:hypothetical protein
MCIELNCCELYNQLQKVDLSLPSCLSDAMFHCYNKMQVGNAKTPSERSIRNLNYELQLKFQYEQPFRFQSG